MEKKGERGGESEDHILVIYKESDISIDMPFTHVKLAPTAIFNFYAFSFRRLCGSTVINIRFSLAHTSAEGVCGLVPP